MSALLVWAWVVTLPGMLLTGLGVGRPGAASLGGPAVIGVLALGWLLGPRAPAEFVQPGWLPFLPNGAFHLRLDALSAVMLAVVGLVSLCIYVYSLGYMDDPEYADADRRRYFMYLDFFVASMAILVLAGNLAVLLVGWTGVGLASFLLISFRRKLPGSLGAGLQALAANAIGDAALLVAIVLLPNGCGDLLTLQSPACVAVPGGAATLAWLLLIASSAKSAQGPLYFWLPSAMAGPTPVSALIHAATMVAAGVYLLVRTHTLFPLGSSATVALALLGVITALFGGVMSLQQPNFKRGLAYSTVSQLGYMFAAIGAGAPFAALFHLITHASFKALLFLSAGIVIHAKHGEEELSKLGGLRRLLPGAHATFLIGSLALIGVPGFSGAFSKDAILEAMETQGPIPPLLFFGLFAGVFLTGLYIGRLFFGVFYGPPSRAEDSGLGTEDSVTRSDSVLSPQRSGLHEPGVMLWPLVPLAVGAVLLGYLEWPVPLLSTVLGDTVGHAEPVHLISPLGISAGLLGLAGFAISAWRSRERAPERPARPDEGGWVASVADLGFGIAGRLAAVHSGQLGRYAMLSVVAIALVLLLGLASSIIGARAALRGLGA
jgi:NADH-quinone oxidoreductase subunit L